MASADEGLEVAFWLDGEQVLKVSADEAPERLAELARVLLTAIHRLDHIEAAEEAVAEEDGVKLSYTLDCGSDLLSIKQAAQVLHLFDPDQYAEEAKPTTA